MITAQHSNFVSPLNKLFTAERALYLSPVYPDLFYLISRASRHYLRNNSDTCAVGSLQSARSLIQHCCMCCVFLSTVVWGSQCNTDTQFYDSINPRELAHWLTWTVFARSQWQRVKVKALRRVTHSWLKSQISTKQTERCSAEHSSQSRTGWSTDSRTGSRDCAFTWISNSDDISESTIAVR